MTVHGTLFFPPGVPATPAHSSSSQAFQFRRQRMEQFDGGSGQLDVYLPGWPRRQQHGKPERNLLSDLPEWRGRRGQPADGERQRAAGPAKPGRRHLVVRQRSALAGCVGHLDHPSNSPLLEIQASSWSSSGDGARAQTFAWQTQPVNSDTASPSGKLALLYGYNGAAPAATGLSIAPNGQINFAAGQQFPVTGTGGGTITGITTSSPLTGSGTTGSVALGLDTSALDTTLNGLYPQLAAYNTYTAGNNFSGGLSASAHKRHRRRLRDGNRRCSGCSGLHRLRHRSLWICLKHRVRRLLRQQHNRQRRCVRGGRCNRKPWPGDRVEGVCAESLLDSGTS